MQMTNFASQNQIQMQPMFKSGCSEISDLQSINHNQERSDNAFYSVQTNNKQISIDKKRVANRNSGDHIHLSSGKRQFGSRNTSNNGSGNAGSSVQTKNKSSSSGWFSSSDGRIMSQMNYEEQKINTQSRIYF